jgi:O-antigen ligase
MAIAEVGAASRLRRRSARGSSARIARLALAVGPALLVGYLAFQDGGYYAEAYGSAAALLALAVGGVALASRSRFGAGFSRALTVAAGALVLLVAWTWLSSLWSNAPASAVFETPRVALYLLTLVFFGSFLASERRLVVAAAGVAVAMGAVCGAALATELFPDVFPTSSPLSAQRLAFPLGYWNSLGLFAAITVVLLFHLTSDPRSPSRVRVLAAAALPVPVLTLYFTFSRGALGALAIGLLAYLAVGRCRGVVAGAMAAGPATALALGAAYSAELLSGEQNRTAAAAAQGHRVAAWLLAGCVVGGALRTAVLPLDDRVARMQLPSPRTRAPLVAAAVFAAVLLSGVAIALNAPARLHDAYDSFTRPELRSDARSRFHQVTLSGRQEHWEVALRYFRAHPLTGEGAGTFETQWLRSRSSITDAREAHSLYVEALAELGIVGLALIVTAFVAILLGLLRRARADRRALYGALFAAMLMWAVHAGVDWDWELPAVGLALFGLAAMGLARPVADGGRAESTITSWPVRIAVALACALIGVAAIRTVVADTAHNEAKAALEAGRCGDAIAASRTAVSAVGSDPVGHEVIGWCLIQSGQPAAAAGQMTQAVRNAPDHWRFQYGLAIARAAEGRDPFPDLVLARRLNRHGAILVDSAGHEVPLTRGSKGWRRLALNAIRPAGVGSRP